MKSVYIVISEEKEYNDEYWSTYEYTTHPLGTIQKVFSNEQEAQALADTINATDLCATPLDFYGGWDGFNEKLVIPKHIEDELLEQYSISDLYNLGEVFAGDSPFKHLSMEDRKLLVKLNPCFHTTFVRECEVIDE